MQALPLYDHQAIAKGGGCDCLGLIQGVFRRFHVPDGESPPPYTREWGEVAREETMLATARRHLADT